MFKSFAFAALASLVVCSSAAFAAGKADILGIVTGPKTGTYFAFGKDISEVSAKAGVNVEAKTSEGSIDNIKRINSAENAAVGIVQSDVLGFLARSKSPDSIKMASNLRMIFPFYNEEVHILARKEIKNFSDLEGKKVAIGEEGSGNMLTSINLFSMMNVNPAEMKKISPAQGVVSVLRGELDAVVSVAGKPVRLFKNLEDLTLPENQKYAPMLDQVHFLSLDNPKMLEEYKPAEIAKTDYNFVKQAVPTIAVQAVLVSYDFAGTGSKRRCDMLAGMAKAVRDHIEELKKTGHPKWKEVDLDGKTAYWKKDSCVWPDAAGQAAEDSKGLEHDLITIIEGAN
ncbi:MAG: TAXI family TRAP transporter solute-binding subunit [Alphaproteobacteria bacterium]